MQIFLQSLGGTTTYNVTPDMTVEALKARVENEEFIPMTLQRLCFGTSQLMTGTLEENGLEEADTIKLLMNVNGGMRAKWRKKRMRRLRRKRRKMRQRAR